MINTSPAKIDALLEPLLLEVSPEQSDELLLELITDHAAPVIKGVIRYKLHPGTDRAGARDEAEDIYQEVLLQLLTQLQRLRARPDQYPIGDLRGMAAVIAHRACSRWMRRQFPERHALKNRLHYLLTRQPGLALWPDEGGKLLAGFAAWQEKKRKAVAASQLGQLTDGGGEPLYVQMINGGTRGWADALAAIFNHLGGPVEFDELVGALAPLLGVRDQPIESLDDDRDAAALLPAAGGVDPAWQAEKRIFLQRLWEELQQLPPNQRSALLLNLRDASGGGCITLFPSTGVATLRELADALGMSADSFARLWNDLPLEDARIAELLGLTRQQVINARKSGRERLARRLKGFI